MDYQFPQQLFPLFYNSGPPASVKKNCAGDWGCYDRVRPQGTSGPLSSWTFTPRRQVKGETWCHTEPVPVPLFSPKTAVVGPLTPPDPMDFTEHMQNFFMDHCHDAFGCMGEILGEKFRSQEQGVKKSSPSDSVNMWKVKKFLKALNCKIGHKSHSSRSLDMYSSLLSDVVHDIPPQLLGTLLHEELSQQRDRLLFSEGATGGALAFVPFSQSGGSSQRGCLLYPGNQGLECLNFHRVELNHSREKSFFVDTSSIEPSCFQLKASIRQISSASLFNDCCVAMRSDHLCGVWRFSEQHEPCLLEVVNTREVATCISVSPHILGEVLVASESGAAKLWTVGRGMHTVREEDHNLYFNAKSSWRWCEFSAHPRVMLYADRSGVELTDMRAKPAPSHTLFRISNTSECRSGERLILSRYLGDVHPFHHLITTQYSAYIMDERFPTVPMLKLDHMMQAPPVFSHIVPGPASSGSAVSEAGTTKVLLGSHSSQEVMLLQYSGGRAEACFSRGPPQAMLRARDSMNRLPVQIPHHLEYANNRLSSPAIGMTCIQKKGGRRAASDECICILQLTEAGDIFYQTLEPEQPGGCGPPAAEDEPLPQQATKYLPQVPYKPTTPGRKAGHQPFSHPMVSVTSDEDVIGPTQALSGPKFVAETPEKARQEMDFSSEDSELEGKGRGLKRLMLQVVVNDSEPDDEEEEPDARGKDGAVGKSDADNTEDPAVLGENDGPSCLTPAAQIKLSYAALATWKRWLQKLTHKSQAKKPRPRSLQHFTVQSEGVLRLPHDKAQDGAEEERVQSLRRDLRACMTTRSLLLQSTSPALPAPDVAPVPDPVDTDSWTDRLSRRLTCSWQGEEAWQAWCEDELGLNKQEKVAALKRKRRREKEARRASGRRLDLSGSFTSSISYQSELKDFSDSAGSLSASQGAWSDTDGALTQSQGFATPSKPQMDTPVSKPIATPQRVTDKGGDQQTPRRSRILSLIQSPKPDSASTSQRRKRPAEDYLSSLFAQQDEKHGSFVVEEEGAVHPPPLPVSSSSRLHGSQRSVRVDLSQDTSMSRYSQSWSQLEGSQSLLGTPLSKKKKSRMGF